MSRIENIAHGNDLTSLVLDDGSVFHLSDDHKMGCAEAWFGSEGEDDDDFTLSYMMFDYNIKSLQVESLEFSASVSELSDGNYEVCHFSKLNETDSGCETAYNDNGTLPVLMNFFNNHKAYVLNGCSLLVEHNNCAEFLY
jgi:hypothetical protein